jgi:3-deoxy-D-manno-octulosonate 8-phosphate phosphatase KdsC-like HAD superfamily phosphatase
MGIVLLRKAGIPCGILTSENTNIGLKRGKKLGLEYVYTGVGRVVDGVKMTKLDAAKEICKELGITLDEVCFVGDDVIFSGDTLFAGGMGRVGFPTGDAAIMADSLIKLSEMDESLTLCSGHGLISDIKTEKHTNPYIRMAKNGTLYG